jgi:DNA-binding MurR/RpiR family transcriptional regulator
MGHVNHQAPQNIAEALGRSYSSVVRKIQQLGLSTAVSKYSLRDLRRDLHVRHSTIVRWIAEGKLKVTLKKRKLKRGHQQRIREEDLVEFLAKYHQKLDGRNWSTGASHQANYRRCFGQEFC